MSRPSIDLQSLLEDKFEDWERSRLQAESEPTLASADEVLETLLRRHGGSHIYFVSGTGSMGSVQSFRNAYGNAMAWQEYEHEIQSELSDEDLVGLDFRSLVNGLAR